MPAAVKGQNFVRNIRDILIFVRSVIRYFRVNGRRRQFSKASDQLRGLLCFILGDNAHRALHADLAAERILGIRCIFKSRRIGNRLDGIVRVIQIVFYGYFMYVAGTAQFFPGGIFDLCKIHILLGSVSVATEKSCAFFCLFRRCGNRLITDRIESVSFRERYTVHLRLFSSIIVIRIFFRRILFRIFVPSVLRSLFHIGILDRFRLLSGV